MSGHRLRQRHRCLVGPTDVLHDGETESTALCACRLPAINTLEHALAFRLGNTGAVVFDLEHNALVCCCHANRHPAFWRCVANGVVDEIGDQFAQE